MLQCIRWAPVHEREAFDSPWPRVYWVAGALFLAIVNLTTDRSPCRLWTSDLIAVAGILAEKFPFACGVW